MKLQPGFKLLVCTVLFSAGLWAGRCEAAGITYDESGLTRGSAISTSVNAPYLKDFGLTITADNMDLPGRQESVIFDSAGPFHEATISSGNNSAECIDPITADQPGLLHFDRVGINFGESASVDNIRFNPVPEPASMLLVGSGLIVLAWFGRKKTARKKKQIVA